MNTNGYGGKTLVKKIDVRTDDPARQRIRLTVRGEVDSVVEISPEVVRLKGTVDENVTSAVTVVPSDKYDFSILSGQVKKGEDIRAEFQKDVPSEGCWRIVVKNIRKKSGRYYDEIHLETDSELKPRVKIRVFGTITENEKKEKS